MKLSRANGIASVSIISLIISPLTISLFSLVLSPISESMGWSIGAVSIGAALFYFMSGLASLFAGKLVEKFGSRVSLSLLLAIGGFSCFFIGQISQLWQLYLIVGVIFPFGSSGAVMVIISVLISNWFGKNKGMTLNIVALGLPIGQLLLIPVFSVILMRYTWRFVYVPLGFAILVVSAMVYVVIKETPWIPQSKTRNDEQSVDHQKQSLRFSQAIRTKAFYFICLSYFACGFTDFLVTIHLPSFALAEHLSAQSGAYSLSIIGGANIVGLLLTGRVSDNSGPRFTVALTYATRLFSMLFLLFLIRSVDSLYFFSFVFGLTFFTTAPLTANLVRESFGGKNMGSIYGALGLVHSIGGGLGAFFGGFAYDVTGNYYDAFLTGTIILLAGTVCAFAVTFRTYGAFDRKLVSI